MARIKIHRLSGQTETPYNCNVDLSKLNQDNKAIIFGNFNGVTSRAGIYGTMTKGGTKSLLFTAENGDTYEFTITRM